MYEEQSDQYLIHSDVFLSTEDKTNGEFLKNSIQFFILLNENNGDMNVVDDDGDLDLNRPERIDLSLGISVTYFRMCKN